MLINLIDAASKGGVEIFLSDAALFLEMMGVTAAAWQWMVQALAAKVGLKKAKSASEKKFHLGKIHAFRYFFAYETPKTRALAPRLTGSDPITVEMQPDFFKD